MAEDNVLWLRFLLVYAVAQAAADGPPSCITHPPVEEPLEFPDGLTDPRQLAKWALQVVAKRHQSRDSESRQEEVPRASEHAGDYGVYFVWEHPTDPEVYMPSSRRPMKGWASWWEFPEWKQFAVQYAMYHARFDQGKFGHVRPKPTTVATTSWALYESLDQCFLTREERAVMGLGPQTTEERLRVSASWGCWASGFVERVLKAWCRWRVEQGLQSEAQERQVLLSKLTAEALQRKHELNDHVPYRKGCPVCVAAQGRMRCHRRASVVGVHAASFDLAGPYVAGRCFDPTASGRERGLGYRYFVACAFTFPLARVKLEDSAPVKVVPRDDVEEDEPPPLLEPLDHEEMEAGVSAVRFRKRAKASEDPDLPDVDLLEDPPLPPPPEHPDAEGLEALKAKDGVRTRTLCLGVPVRSKKGREVFGAVQTIINRLEAFGFPVHRYHANRAQELKSRALVGWLRDRGIHGTWTPGDTPAGNKAEIAVQHLKGLARKLLLSAHLEPSYWPLAILHASNRNWVTMCESLGVPQPALLPFGMKLQARKRVKTGFPAHWRERTVSGLYLGQAPDTPRGHLVLTSGDGEAKVLLTNTVYPVLERTVAGKKPKYRIRGKLTPDLVFKHVRAAVLLLPGGPVVSTEARFAPGGSTWALVLLHFMGFCLIVFQGLGCRLKLRRVRSGKLAMRPGMRSSRQIGCK